MAQQQGNGGSSRACTSQAGCTAAAGLHITGWTEQQQGLHKAGVARQQRAAHRRLDEQQQLHVAGKRHGSTGLHSSGRIGQQSRRT